MITHAAPLPPDFYEKTLRNIANLRQEHEHNDTLHRFLGDAEAAIANLIVLESETRTDRDAARAALGAELNESTEAAAVRVIKLGLRFAEERDTARGAVQALEKSAMRVVRASKVSRRLADLYFEPPHGRLETVRDDLGAEPGQGVTWKARAVIRERDEARNERDRALAAALEARNERDEAIKEREFARFHLASMEECFKVAQGKLATLLVERDAAVLHAGKCALNAGHIAAGNHARKRLRDEIKDWRTRFDALATRAADLVKERDEARAALFVPPIEPVSFAQKFARTRRDRDLLKVGDRVVNKKRVVEVATVIGFFDSIDGVRFAAVENDFGRADFWRLDLVLAVKS